LTADGTKVHHNKTIGDINRYPTKADAKRAVESLRAEINFTAADKIGRMTVAEAWWHFQSNELRDTDMDRSPTTIRGYMDYFRGRILPKWGNVMLNDIKSVAVEKWLRSLDLAPGSKAKLRNHLSSLFSHCIRHELYAKLNPIASVRQSAVRQREPEVLTLQEMRSILTNIEIPVFRVMVATAAASALRRSEMRGLKWEDVDLENCWFHCRRGVVNKDQTKMKTNASRKSVEMNPALAAALLAWREQTPYNQDGDWVFASPYTHGTRPYWPDMVLKNHVRPAAAKAGITKTIGWHTFRHSLATLLGRQREDVKVVQELLRHASSKITTDIYQQGDTTAKRNALSRMSGIFAVPALGS
jgi:integrase